MANIKSIGGNPIVVGLDGLTDDAKVTLLANRPSATLSGSIVTADDAAPTTPVDTTVYGQSTQDGTPTPEAPVPIVSVGGQPVDADGWTHGGIDGSTGAVTTSNTRIHTDLIPVVGGKPYTLSWDEGATYGLEVYQYDANGGYVSVSHAWRLTPYAFTAEATTAYVRLLAYNKTTTNIAESEGAVFKARMSGSVIPYVPYGCAGLWAHGANLLDPSIAAGNTWQGITVTPSSDGWFAVSGTSTATSAGIINMWGTNNAVLFYPGQYTLMVETEGTTLFADKLMVQVYGQRDGSGRGEYFGGATSRTFTYDGPIARVSFYISETSSGTTVNGRFRLTLVSGTTAPTAYIPYVETVTPIPLDGHELRSLPDGTRDELTVDAEGHVTLVQRVGSKSIAASDWTLTSGDRYGVYLSPYATGNNPFMSTAYVRDTATNPAANGMRIGASGNQAILGAGSTLVDSELLYALATPVSHDLGTVALAPLVGPDLTAQTVPTAPLALTYERDATIALDRLTAMWANVAPVEGDTASANYSVGSYLMHGGQLCRVTTAIATGETIAIGTNVTATTVMAEVVSLTQ